MLENTLLALVRSVLLAAVPGVEVNALYQPSTVGMPSGPQILQQVIMSRRYGALRREDRWPTTPAEEFQHIETQWWETTLQIGATARLDPTDPNYMASRTAMDICKAASDALQSDTGLAALAVQRVRPLRITEIRQVRFVNDSDQYEAMPSFDVVLSHPQVTISTTPPAVTLEPDFGRV